MNKVIICLANEKLYLDPEVQKVILEISDGIIFAGKREGYWLYTEQKEKSQNSFSLNRSLEKLPIYIDEPISTPTPDNVNYEQIIKGNPGVLIGEPDLDAIEELIKLGCKNITYTAYSGYWKIGNWRIPKWFGLWGNQIPVWVGLEKKYNLWDYSTEQYDIETFHYCWLKLGQRDMKKCIQWTDSHNKQELLYIPDGLSKETFINQINKFKEYL